MKTSLLRYTLIVFLFILATPELLAQRTIRYHFPKEEQQETRSELRNDHSFAIKLGVTHVSYGEYLVSTEFPVAGRLAGELGFGLTSHNGNMWRKLSRFSYYPAKDAEGESLGYSTMLRSKLYFGRSKVTGPYLSADYHFRKYRFARVFPSDESVYHGVSYFHDVTLSIGWLVNIRDRVAVDVYAGIGQRYMRGRDAGGGSSSSYTVEPIDENTLAPQFGLQLGMFID